MTAIPRTGPIEAIDRERLVDHRDEERLWAWVREAPADATVPAGLLGAADGVLPDATPVILGLPEAGHPLLAEAVRRAAAGRVYALVGPGAELGPLEDAARGLILVRRLSRRPPPFLVSADGRRGLVPFRGRWLALPSGLAGALRQAATWLFWNDAEAEARGGAGRLRFGDVPERPFDVSRPRIGPAILAEVAPRLAPRAVVAGGPANGRTRLLVRDPAVDPDPETLAVVERDGRVVALDPVPPTLSLDEHGGELLLGGPDGWWLRLVLDAPEARLLVDALEGAAPVETLRLRPRLGELAGRVVRLPGRSDFEAVADSLELDAGDARALDLPGLPAAEPAKWPESPAPHLAHRVRWRARPPVAPAGARTDPLVMDWAELDATVAKRLAEATAALDRVEARRGAAERFRDLVRSWLGFGRTLERLRREAEELGEGLPSALGPAGAAGLVDRLASLEAAVRDLAGQVEAAERQARLEAARAEQEAEHARRREAARREAEELARRLGEAEEKLAEAAAKLAELEQVPRPDDKQARRRRRKELEAARRHHRALDREHERLRRELEAARAAAEAPFAFRPPAEPGEGPGEAADFVPSPPDEAPRVPAEALPAVGRLLSARKRRWLVIRRWDDFEDASREAERLGATVVAEEAR